MSLNARHPGYLARRGMVLLAVVVGIVGLRLVPAPPPARADVCGAPVISSACSVAGAFAKGLVDGVSWTWNTGSGAVSGVFEGTKWAMNTTTGLISTGQTVVGKIVAGPLGSLTCTLVGNVGEGWWGKVCNAAKSVYGKALSVVGKAKSTASSIAGQAKKAPSGAVRTQVGAGGGITLAGITGWVGAGAVWVLHKGASVVGDTTEPNVHAPFFEREYKRMMGLAALLALLMLLLAVIEGLLRSNWDILRRAVVAVPTAFLIGAMAVVVVGLGVTLSDLMGQAAAAGAQADAKKFFDHAATVLGVLLMVGGAAGHFLAGPAPAAAHVIKGAPLFILATGSLYAFLAAGLVLLELFMREVGIFATLLFVPIVLAARIWPRLSHWARDLTQGLVALVLSKFVIVAILAFAAAAGASWHPAVLLLAIGLVTVAAMAPAALFGLVRFADHSWHQRSVGRGAVPQAQAVSAAEQMRRTFMANNPSHRIDPPGRSSTPTGGNGQRAEGGDDSSARRDESSARNQSRAAERVRDEERKDEGGGGAEGGCGRGPGSPSRQGAGGGPGSPTGEGAAGRGPGPSGSTTVASPGPSARGPRAGGAGGDRTLPPASGTGTDETGGDRARRRGSGSGDVNPPESRPPMSRPPRDGGSQDKS